jgi:hypothetical protein
MSIAEIHSALARAMVIAKSQPPDQRYLDALEAVVLMPVYAQYIDDQEFEMGSPEEARFRSFAAMAWLAGILARDSEAFVN